MTGVARTENFAVGRLKANYYRHFELLAQFSLLRLAVKTLGWLYLLATGEKFDFETSRDLAKLFVNGEQRTHLEKSIARLTDLSSQTRMQAVFFGGEAFPIWCTVPKDDVVAAVEKNLVDLHQQEVDVLQGMIKRRAKLNLVERTVAKRWDTFNLKEKVKFVSLFHDVGRYEFAAKYLQAEKSENEIASFASVLMVDFDAAGRLVPRPVEEAQKIVKEIKFVVDYPADEDALTKNLFSCALLGLQDVLAGLIREKVKLDLVQRQVAAYWDKFGSEERTQFISLFHEAGKYDFIVHHLASQVKPINEFSKAVPLEVVISIVAALLQGRKGSFRPAEEVVEIMAGIVQAVEDYSDPAVITPKTLWSALIDYAPAEIRSRLGWKIMAKLYS